MDNWISHDNESWPKGVDPYDQVAVRFANGDTIKDITAYHVDWIQQDAVVQYKVVKKHA